MIDPEQLQVFIATYRRPEMLARQLDSLLDQTFRPREITVLDNASDAATRQIVESRAPRGARYVATSDLGSLGNMKFAIAHAHDTGYVAVFHDDDCVAPTYFESVAKVISAGGGGILSWSVPVGNVSRRISSSRRNRRTRADSSSQVRTGPCTCMRAFLASIRSRFTAPTVFGCWTLNRFTPIMGVPATLPFCSQRWKMVGGQPI